MSPLEILRTRKLIIPMLAIFIALLVQTSWVEEDAFITLRTADNFIHGYGLRWNIAERVQTFTNPLWLFLLAGAHALIANPHLTLILVSLITSALAFLILLLYIPQNNFGLLLAFATLTLSKSFVDFSTSGLENPATHLIAVLFVILYFKIEKPVSDRQRFMLCLLAGLAAFNRMDTLLFYLPALAVLFRTPLTKRTAFITLAGFAPFIVWELFALIYYGFPVPNTYYAKLNTGVPVREKLTQGIVYFFNSLGWDPITLTLTFSALTLTFLSKRREDMLIALGVALYLGYILFIGGDFMSGRFFSTPLLISTMLLVRRAEDGTSLEKYIWISLVLLLGLLLAPLKSFANPLESDLVTFDNTSGIADERVGYYRFSNLLLFSRREALTLHPFVEYGLRLKQDQTKVAIFSGIGMTGYFAGPNVHIVDELALGDPLLSHLKPSDPTDWNIAHFKRAIPNGYIETIASGTNQIADPNLAVYYEKLHLITSGDLWTAARWDAIWKINTGKYQYLLDVYEKAQP